MKKNKKRSEDIVDPKVITELTADLLSCARCLDGDVNASCQHKADCDQYVVERMLKSVGLTEELQKGCSEKTVQSISSKLTGFIFRNGLTQEYKCKVSKTIAETAKNLEYAAEVVLGREG